MDWGADDPVVNQGYLNDDEFALSMDSTFGPGNWSQTGGWRSQQRENALRAQGAQTVAPDHVSAHSVGDADAPGARDIVVKGMSPDQAAQVMRKNGTWGANETYPEGQSGTQGAHLHVGMAPGAHQGWGADDPVVQPWGQDDPVLDPSGAMSKDDHGFQQQVARFVEAGAGGMVKGFGDVLHAFGVTGDAAGRAAAKQGAETGYIVLGQGIIKLTAQQRAEAQQEIATNAKAASPQIEPVAKKLQALGEQIAPQNRNLAESLAHGGGEMVPALGAAAANPALGASVFAMQGYAEAHDDAIAHGASEDEADQAGRANAAIQGGLGALPVGHAAGAVTKGIENAAARVGARYIAGAAGNATLMGAMRAGGNVVAKQTYDPNRDWADQVPQAMAQGAVGDLIIHGTHDAIGAGVNAGKTLLRPREAPVTQPGNPAVTDAMPETDAIRAYAGQGALHGDEVGSAPVRGDPVLFQTPEGIAHGTVTGETADQRVVVETPAGPVVVPHDQAVPLPKDYEGERVAHGAPLEQMPQAIADTTELRQAAPKGYSLFQAMKDLGGIRTKTPDGSPESDVQAVLDGVRRPGLTNNKTGLSPDAMRAALQERGWFGALDQSQQAEDFGEAKPGDDVNALYELMRREAAGRKVLHPSADGSQARRTDLEEQMRQAGVGLSDPIETAAAKLAAWRGEQVLSRTPDAEAVRARAQELGLTPHPDAGYDDLLADVLEREAISAEADGWTWDHGEERTDSVLTPDEHEWLTAAGRGPESERDPAFPAPAAVGEAGDRPGAQEGAEEPRAGADGDREGPQGLPGQDQLTPRRHFRQRELTAEETAELQQMSEDRAVLQDKLREALARGDTDRAGMLRAAIQSHAREMATLVSKTMEEAPSERVDLANGQHDQLLIPGGERSAIQAAAAREGPLKAKAPQQDAGGLFAPPEPDQGEIKFARAAGRPYPLAPRTEWYGDANYEQTGGRIEWMSPDEFLGRARHLDPTGDETARDNIDDLKQHIESGRTLDPLALYPNGKEDGRHRAWAAKELGIDRVPVLTWDGAKLAKAPIFYSALERHVDNSTLKAATPEQWKATIKNAPGLKKEEIEWTGVNDWLDLFGQDKVPKDALQAFIRDNGVKVEEKVLAAQTIADDVAPSPEVTARHQAEWDALTARIRELRDQYEATRDGDAHFEMQDQEQIRDALHDRMVRETLQEMGLSGEPTQYNDWTLPGGSDYRELLLTLPKEANPPATHWDTPGVLAHVRFDTRTAPDGKKVLFIQEVQSDWHQKGRDQGYEQPRRKEEIDALGEKVHAAIDEWEKAHAHAMSLAAAGHRARLDSLDYLKGNEKAKEDVGNQLMASLRGLAPADQLKRAATFIELAPGGPEALEREKAADLKVREARQAHINAMRPSGITNAPFKSSWPALVMKRVIRWAADHDMDRISWTTGAQQGERYDLTKHVGRLTLQDNSSGGVGRPQMEGPFEGGTLVIHSPEGRQVGEHYIRGASSPENARKALEDVIGRELTERLLSQPAREARTAGLGVRERHLEGLDVKIGAEGMHAFYDRNLVNITNDLIKKYGAKVDKSKVSGTASDRDVDVAHADSAEWRAAQAEVAARYHEMRDAPEGGIEKSMAHNRWMDARRHADEVEQRIAAEVGPDQHSFDITPAMKEAASGGLPLFKRRAEPSDFRQPKGVVVGRAVPGDAEAKAFTDKVESVVRKIAPFAEVVPARHITELSTGDKAMGVSWRDGLRHIIGWSVDSPDAIGIARHEAVHALRAAGTIRPEEWETLEEAATNEDWRGRYDIARRYGDLTHDQQVEESVAERFREWRRDGEKGLRGTIQTVFQRLAKLFDQVRDLAKRAFGATASASDIFSRMESGEIGQRVGREYNPPPTPAPHDAEPAFARPANPRAADRARREAEAQREIDEREGRLTPGALRSHSAINDILGSGLETGARKLQSAAAKALPDPVAEALEETGHAVNMAVNPMAAGSSRAQAAAKDFANALRLADFQHERLDKYLDRRFTDEQQRRMWEAADEHGVLLRRGEEPGPGQGLNRLDPEERAAVENLQARADTAFDEASALGMVKGDGLESYVPRMVVQMTAFGPKVLERAGPRAQRKGGNLSTTTGQLRQRKYETTSETEAAADKAFGNKATVVRNIRTLPLATQRLERAIAGRTLVNRIKELSSQTGEPLVVDGQKPNDNYFTMDHPALQVWRPRFVTDPETGKTTAAVDQNGDVVFDAHPLWIAKEFEGPLKAVLSTPTGSIVRGIAELKAKMMGVIMYSPLMHNAVIWGRALAADPIGVASFEAYRRGFRAKSDPQTMAEAIKAGMVPISRHFDKIDTASIANSGATFVPGRSWTSQVLGYIPGLFDKAAGDAVKEKVDQFGDLWHNTFLWDRVADLQAGLYVKMRDDLMRKAEKFGITPETAQKIAAHYANRYAGSLPTEGMSKVARQLANWVLFSRSFTLGNMAAFKDVVKGLPSDVRGQIERDGGAQQLLNAQGVARRKAIGMLALDAAFAFAGLWLAAGATAWLTHQRFQAPSDNEDKYKNRFLLRYQADGTAVYGRLPTGKTVEDQWHWMTQPITTLHQKLSPYGRLVSAIWSNDKGFGRKLYDPYDHTAGAVGKNVVRIVWDMMQSLAPTGQLEGSKEALVGGPGVDRKTAALQALLPIAGITVSKGAPGGPAMGDYYAAKDEHDFQVQQALPGIQKQIKGGDIAGARQAMTALGIAPGLQNYYVRVAQNPALRMSGRKLRDFERFADDRQKAQFAADRAAGAGRRGQ